MLHDYLIADGMIYLIAKICILVAVLLIWFAIESSPAV